MCYVFKPSRGENQFASTGQAPRLRKKGHVGLRLQLLPKESLSMGAPGGFLRG